MIEDLKLIGLPDDLILKMNERLNDDILLSLAFNHDLVKENLGYFKSIGINNLDELMLRRPDIFTLKPNFIQSSFKKGNLYDEVNNLNQDYLSIDDILFPKID